MNKYSGFVVQDMLNKRTIATWLLNQDFLRALDIRSETISFNDLVSYAHGSDLKKMIDHQRIQRENKLRDEVIADADAFEDETNFYGQTKQ